MARPVVRFEVDTSEFERALKFYQKATGKTDAEVIARAARNVAFKALDETKSASAADIRKHKPRRRWKGIPKGHPSRLLYAKHQKREGKRLSNADADLEYQRRDQSRGWLKAHWLAIAFEVIERSRYLGGSFATLKTRRKVRNSELVAKARRWADVNFNLKKSVMKFVDLDVMVERSAMPIMTAARDKALRRVGGDMMRYALRKYEIDARKVSA